MDKVPEISRRGRAFPVRAFGPKAGTVKGWPMDGRDRGIDNHDGD